MIDLIIVIAYFATVMTLALRGKGGQEMSQEEYFLSGRKLSWYSVAISTIATNIQGYQFLGMMGSAYLYGLAQANLEINAMQGLLMAAFIFVPMYLRDKVITITQWIQKRMGKTVGYLYSGANILIFSTVGLGAALFWGAYAADTLFGEYLIFISEDPITRITVLIIGLGVFSAIYTYYGGLSAVVRTDIIQFSILLIGGIILLVVALRQIGGWSALYDKTPELMHLHLPREHPTLPWIAIPGMLLLNINYWCANQVVMQRSLAAKSLRHAQAGLMIGGVMKYFMAILIIVPGIALAGMLDNPLSDPDETFPYLVKNFLSPGLRGIIVCALFASLMSTVDSLFNSLATLFSIDIYKGIICKGASEKEVVLAGRRTILFTLVTGITMGIVLLNVKFNNPENAFTHTLNELRYYINCGIVILIMTTAFIWIKDKAWIIIAFLSSIPLQLIFKHVFPDMNYFVRAMWVIIIPLMVLGLSTLISKNRWLTKNLVTSADKTMTISGWCLLVSLVVIHLIFS